jgi:Domain of unknown function (DUF4279)
MTFEITEYEVQIALDITSKTIPAIEIASKIGGRPDKIAQMGERDPVRVIPKMNIVAYRSSATSKKSDLVEHWGNLKARLSEKSNVLKEISKSANILITIIVKQEDRFPALELENDFLEFAYKSGASIQVDTYE